MNRELISRYEEFFGKKETEELLRIAPKLKSQSFIRINTSRTTIKEVKEFLKKNRAQYSETFLPHSLKIEKSFFRVSSSLPALLGEIYEQDLASQVPVHCIDFESLKKLKREVKILDMASAPGSKLTQLADLLTSKGVSYHITALEPQDKRLTGLKNNIQKQAFPHIEVIQSKGEDFDSKEKYDLILLDAPCSGNLVGDPKWLEKRDVAGIRKLASLQRELLKKAVSLLSEKGQLIYSTCSMEPEENEENIEWFLREYKGFKVQKVNLSFPFDVEPLKKFKNQGSIRFFSPKSGTEGFFICSFRNKKF
jgi:16S rRNA (cytosine967-C5)-methyltransferase